MKKLFALLVSFGMS